MDRLVGLITTQESAVLGRKELERLTCKSSNPISKYTIGQHCQDTHSMPIQIDTTAAIHLFGKKLFLPQPWCLSTRCGLL